MLCARAVISAISHQVYGVPSVNSHTSIKLWRKFIHEFSEKCFAILNMFLLFWLSSMLTGPFGPLY